LNLICPKELLQGAPDKMITKPVTAPSLAVRETETSVA
jgi:hypothetical protein